MKPSSCSVLFLASLACVNASAASDPVEKGFIYKQTPHGELQLIVSFPPDAKPGDQRPATVFFSGGAWHNSTITQFKEQVAYLARRGMVAERVAASGASAGANAMPAASRADKAGRWKKCGDEAGRGKNNILFRRQLPPGIETAAKSIPAGAPARGCRSLCD